MVFAKNAAILSPISTIIILLVSAFLMLTLFSTHAENVNDLTGITLCAQSLRAQSFGEKLTYIKSYKNMCYTMVAKNPVPSKYATTKEEVMRELAEHMVAMWDMIGRGQIQGMWTDSVWHQLFGKDQCLILYQIPVVKTSFFTERNSISMFEFQNYLETAYYDARKEITFADYFKYSGDLGFYDVGLFMDTEQMSEEECRTHPDVQRGLTPPDCTLEYVVPGQVYVISIASPQGSKIWNSEKKGTIISFSTEKYALDQKCKVI